MKHVQMLAVYMIITMAGLSVGQLFGGLDDGITNILFLTVSILVSVAVVPILVTASQAPEFSELETCRFAACSKFRHWPL